MLNKLYKYAKKVQPGDFLKHPGKAEHVFFNNGTKRTFVFVLAIYRMELFFFFLFFL